MLLACCVYSHVDSEDFLVKLLLLFWLESLLEQFKKLCVFCNVDGPYIVCGQQRPSIFPYFVCNVDGLYSEQFLITDLCFLGNPMLKHKANKSVNSYLNVMC